MTALRVMGGLVLLLLLGSRLAPNLSPPSTRFPISDTENIVLNENFDHQNGWQLWNTLEIQDGVLTHRDQGSYGRATYLLHPPLNLSHGAINLYWVGTFPERARKERDAYWAALEYADNPPVCWDRTTNNVVDLPFTRLCPEPYIRVDENSELRVWLRPAVSNSSIRLYLDPGFIPGQDPEDLDYPLAQLTIPTHPDTTAEQYRLRVVQVDENTTEATLYSWNGTGWQRLDSLDGTSLPLSIDAADWIDMDEQLYPPIFNAINLQFRGPGPNGIATRISAVTLTQELSD